MNRSIFILTLVFLLGFTSQAQEVLTLEQAKYLALGNNLNAKISQKNLDQIIKNTRLIKSGLRPTFNIGAGLSGDWNKNRTKIFSNPEAGQFVDAQNYSTSLSATGNLVIWDGNKTKSQITQNEFAANSSQISLDATKDNIIYQVESIYNNILLLDEQKQILEESIDISVKRKLRAQYAFDYGQDTKLNLLNSEVDLNRDSLDLIRFNQQVKSLKRNMNLLLNIDLNTDFILTPTAELNTIQSTSIDQLILDAQSGNNDILLARENLKNISIEESINKSGKRPQISANAGYKYNYQNNTAPSFIDYATVYGLNLGLSLSWNIGDGGRTKTLNEITQIKIESQELAIEALEKNTRAQLETTWEQYLNALLLLDLEKKNVITAKENFDRSLELFELGQINSILFRQAQLNLLNTNLSLSTAKYDIRILYLDIESILGTISK